MAENRRARGGSSRRPPQGPSPPQSGETPPIAHPGAVRAPPAAHPGEVRAPPVADPREVRAPPVAHLSTPPPEAAVPHQEDAVAEAATLRATMP